MAHNTDCIPWDTVANHLVMERDGKPGQRVTDIHPRNLKQRQPKNMLLFAEAIASTVERSSAMERTKYPETYDPISHEEVLISDQVDGKISEAIRKSSASRLLDSRPANSVCGKAWPGPAIYGPSRLLKSFLNPFKDWDGCTLPTDSQRPVLDIIHACIIYDQMEPLLRLAQTPEADLQKTWNIHTWLPVENRGWSQTAHCALLSYICLNILAVMYEGTVPDEASVPHTELLDDEDLTAVDDYRNSRSYQKMLAFTTGRQDLDIFTYPHRDFYGIDRQTYQRKDCRDTTNSFGRVRWWKVPYMYFHFPSGTCLKQLDGPEPYKQLNARRQPVGYIPSSDDVCDVMKMLCRKGLPAELYLEVISLAGYKANRDNVPIADDPLHPRNRKALGKYLDSCWDIVVRCDMLAKECGKRVDWAFEVRECMAELFNLKYPIGEQSHHKVDTCTLALQPDLTLRWGRRKR